jgi:branched-chain amino acid transport system permease protein
VVIPRPLAVAVFAALVVLPAFLNQYLIFVVTVAYIYVILALGLNLLLGYAGQFAFANAAFFGIGAYATALLQLHLGLGFWPSLGLGVAITGIVGVAVGLPALRLSGLYLAMMTLAFGQLFQWVVVHWPTFTFGAGGTKLPAPWFGPSPLTHETNVYYVCLLVAVLAIVATGNLTRSRVGRAMVAIRDSEVAAQALGIDPVRVKIVAFALSALYAGAAGGLYSAVLRYIAPEGFDLFQVVIHFAMIVVGGLGSVTGSVLGAVLLTGLPEVLRTVKGFQEIVFGAILIACIVFLPDGLYSLVRDRLPRWRETAHRRLPSPVVSPVPDPAHGTAER